MTTLAAYQILLTRYTRDPDITIGTPYAGRTHPHLDHLIGFFVSSLPLHANLAANPAFTDLLAQTRTTTLDAFDHQDLPYEQIIEELNPPRDTSRNPLTQAWFDLSSTGTHLNLGTTTTTEPLHLPTTHTRFDLEMHLHETPDGAITGHLVYATDLFEEPAITHLTRHYTTLLDNIAATPRLPISELPHTTPAETTTLLHTWNTTTTPPPPHPTITAWFDHQAALTPHAPALRDGRTTLTYHQLTTTANQLARELQARGIGPETPAAVLLPRGTHLITTILAILKAGGAYLPLDPRHPPDRLHYMLTTAQAPLTITTTHLTHHLPPGTPHLTLDTTPTTHHPPTPPPDHTTPRTLAYIIYTSGSTGRPKGVAVQTGSLVNLVHWHIRTYQPGPGDFVSQTANITFDASTREIWPALLSGACLNLPDAETVTSPDKLHQPLRRQRDHDLVRAHADGAPSPGQAARRHDGPAAHAYRRRQVPAPARPAPRHPGRQPLRTHREHRRHQRNQAAVTAVAATQHRHPDLERAGVHPGRAAASGGDWHARGDLRRRNGCCPWLRRPA